MITAALMDRIAGRVVVASLSGGKDSAAMSLYLAELGIDHRRVFMDTGWEHPKTYDYLRGELARALGPIEEIRGSRGFVELVRHKGMFPGRTRRFCTTELKVRPMAAFIRSAAIAADRDVLNTVGIRAAESEARSRMPEWEWQDTLCCEVWRPLLTWTEEDVIAIHRRHGLRPNPLYLEGARRVGCWPCIFASKAEIRHIAESDPERLVLIGGLELEVEAAMRARYAARGEDLEAEGGLVPTFFTARSEARGARAWPIAAAVAWSRTSRGGRQFEMFTPSSAEAGCVRWGLCETESVVEQLAHSPAAPTVGHP